MVAENRTKAAKALFESKGLKVLRTAVGDSSPVLAIGDELRKYPNQYDVIVLSTLPPGMSRWLRLDAHSRAEAEFNLPMLHVVASRPKGATLGADTS